MVMLPLVADDDDDGDDDGDDDDDDDGYCHFNEYICRRDVINIFSVVMLSFVRLQFDIMFGLG